MPFCFIVKVLLLLVGWPCFPKMLKDPKENLCGTIKRLSIGFEDRYPIFFTDPPKCNAYSFVIIIEKYKSTTRIIHPEIQFINFRLDGAD